MTEKKLPLRIGVGVIVLNDENKVFVGKRKDNPVDKWQMPQGGVDKNENFLSAMKRELYEETSIKSIKVLKELDGLFEYELPQNLLGIIWKGRFRGQKQKWFIARFIGEGVFEKGENILIVDENGKSLARGLSSFTSSEINKIRM